VAARAAASAVRCEHTPHARAHGSLTSPIYKRHLASHRQRKARNLHQAPCWLSQCVPCAICARRARSTASCSVVDTSTIATPAHRRQLRTDLDPPPFPTLHVQRSNTTKQTNAAITTNIALPAFSPKYPVCDGQTCAVVSFPHQIRRWLTRHSTHRLAMRSQTRQRTLMCCAPDKW
jgi:hypothetical protein